MIHSWKKHGKIKHGSDFLQGEDYDIIEKERINGRTFLNITEEKLRSYGMKSRPASNIAVFAKECKDKKLRSFSSYKTKADLEKVLQEDYKILSGDITLIP
jgi:hypothetical protein